MTASNKIMKIHHFIDNPHLAKQGIDDLTATITTNNDSLTIQFSQPISSLTILPEQAIRIANSLLEQATQALQPRQSTKIPESHP